jgi:Protein of unknown function (DUF1569)
MQRRAWLVATPAVALAGCSSAPVQGFTTVADAARAIEGLKAGWRSAGAFTLAQMLNHVAQSIEFSLQGFPDMKSAAFRHTVGAAAFAVFDARGAMRHGLDEPIPGASALAAGLPLEGAITRALKAFTDFEQHTGKLHPHFAYGELDKAQYTRAHLMHLANHWTEVVRA